MYDAQHENPFNLIAAWIFHLRNLNQDLFYQIQNEDRTFHRPKTLRADVDALFAQLPEITRAKKDGGTRLIRYGVPREEIDTVQRWFFYRSFFHMLLVLTRLEERLGKIKTLSSWELCRINQTETGETTEFESLNSNAQEMGFLILPLVDTINDPLRTPNEPSGRIPGAASDLAQATEKTQNADGKHWATDRLPGIQGVLSNTYYVAVDSLVCNGRTYRVRHTVLTRHFFPENKQVLRLAVSPLARGDFLRLATRTEQRGGETQNLVSVEGLKNSAFVHTRIRAACLEAGRRGADILIFPEMLGDSCSTGSEFFYHDIKKTMRGVPLPSLILLPTWWHDRRNELFVRDAGGKLLCTQQKQTRYIFESQDRQQYAEDLRDPEAVIHIVHIPGLGRFAFPICRDFLDPQYIQLLLQTLHVTFLLCPSYSPKKTQFDLTAPGARQFGCYTLWCNTCAAIEEPPIPPAYVGIADGPRGPGTPEILLKPQCGGDCGDGNSPCVFLVEIQMKHFADMKCVHICRNGVQSVTPT